MSARRLGTALLGAGVATITGAVVWWALTYWPVWSYDYLPLTQAGRCLVADSTICHLAAALCSGQHRAIVGAYSPAALWIGMAAILLGVSPHAFSRVDRPLP